MPAPVKLGLVGCGVATLTDLLPNLVLPEVRARVDLVAVCDVVPGRARATAETFGVPRHYEHHEELVLDAAVDLVAIMTPVRHHLPVALAAIAERKHIYVQKTMTETVEEATALIASARDAGVKVVAAPGNHLRSETLRDVRDYIAEGRLGKVCWGRTAKGTLHEVDVRRNDGVGGDVDPTWYYKPGGGPLRDASIYEIHALTWLLGPARRVTAMSGIAVPVRRWRATTIEVELDDNTHFIVDFGGGCFVVFSSHFIKGSSRTPQLELYGEHGAVIVGGGSPNAYEIFGEGEERRRGGYVETLARASGPMVPEGGKIGLEHYLVGDIIHLANCVLADRQPLLSAEHARHGIEIVSKVYESARSGKALEITTTFPRY